MTKLWHKARDLNQDSKGILPYLPDESMLFCNSEFDDKQKYNIFQCCILGTRVYVYLLQ